MEVASSRRVALASPVVTSGWVDGALSNDIEGVGEDATCCCKD